MKTSRAWRGSEYGSCRASRRRHFCHRHCRWIRERCQPRSRARGGSSRSHPILLRLFHGSPLTVVRSQQSHNLYFSSVLIWQTHWSTCCNSTLTGIDVIGRGPTQQECTRCPEHLEILLSRTYALHIRSGLGAHLALHISVRLFLQSCASLSSCTSGTAGIWYQVLDHNGARPVCLMSAAFHKRRAGAILLAVIGSNSWACMQCLAAR